MKKILTAAAAACLILGLAACGTQGGASTAGSSAGSSAASSSAAPSAAVSSAAGSSAALQSENERLQAENQQLREQLQSAQSGTASSDAESSPIDTFFAPYDAAAETTYAMVMVSSAKYDAWHSELTAFVKDMETETSDQQDKEDLENYLENAEEQAKILSQMVYMESAGAETPRDQRADSAGTLAPVSIAQGGAEIFRQAFLRLWDVRYAEESDWTWHFDAAAAKTALDTALAG